MSAHSEHAHADRDSAEYPNGLRPQRVASEGNVQRPFGIVRRQRHRDGGQRDFYGSGEEASTVEAAEPHPENDEQDTCVQQRTGRSAKGEAAMAEDAPPHRLVLGSAAYDAVTSTLREALTDIARSEAASSAADRVNPMIAPFVAPYTPFSMVPMIELVTVA